MTGEDSSKLIGFDGQPLLLFWPSGNGWLARLCFTNAQYQFDHIFIPVSYLAQGPTMIICLTIFSYLLADDMIMKCKLLRKTSLGI